MLTSVQKAEKWKESIQSNVDKTISGVNTLTTSPIVAILANKQKMIDNFTASINSGKWENGLLNNYTFEEWKLLTSIGYEKNRNISDTHIDKMIQYYSDLDNVILSLDLLTDYVIENTDNFFAPEGIQRFMVKQNISTALTKFQQQLKGMNKVEEVFPIIEPYLIDHLNYYYQSNELTDYEGLEGDWDFTDPTKITKDGNGRTSQVDDQSGLNRHFIQGTLLNQPFYGGDQHNGIDLMKFARAASTHMKAYLGLIPTPYTVILVGKIPLHTGTTADYLLRDSHTTGGTGFSYSRSSNNQMYLWANYSVTLGIMPTTFGIHKIVVNASGTTVTSYFNNVVQKIRSVTHDLDHIGATLTLGAYSDGTWGSNASIARLSIFSKVLSTQEDNEILGILNNKYGIF